MKRTSIKNIHLSLDLNYEVVVKGWVRSFRNNKFISLNDGSTIDNLQLVIADDTTSDIISGLTNGSAIEASGQIIESLGKGQRIEVIVATLNILGNCDGATFPIQPRNNPSLEFLRENAHLRFRTNLFAAIFRVRNNLAFAIHKYLHDKGFVYLQTPIITASDAEGAGDMFKVTTLPFENTPRNEDGSVNYNEDFFGRATNLTVSGQLEAELGALALGAVYTFAPTFRAENSNTARHLAEFWMVEPEVAFNDLTDNMDLAEEFIQYLIKYVLGNSKDDLAFLAKRLEDEDKTKPQAERSEMGLIDKLNFVVNNKFERITYTDAIDILIQSKPYKKKQFQYEVKWGMDLQSEHERYLVEKHFKKPVIVIDYPKDIKSFYMRMNDDGKTVAAMDILAPLIGEIVGGSQREERLDLLMKRMEEMNIPKEEMSWYIDSRKYGTAPHSGFGLGFDRLVLFVTGMGNIRDVIPFPRTPKNAEF